MVGGSTVATRGRAVTVDEAKAIAKQLRVLTLCVARKALAVL